jgi:hypothetical protein
MTIEESIIAGASKQKKGGLVGSCVQEHCSKKVI